uniref:Transmembrane protein 199 n=1 Tax=Heliothis virescens TaxID=7102 RepID=A0A2A4JFG3_HELVI
MDSIGSLVDTNLKIFPSNNLLNYLNTITVDDKTPINIARLVKGRKYETNHKTTKEDTNRTPVHLNSNDIENLNKINAIVKAENDEHTEKSDKGENSSKDDVVEEKKTEKETSKEDSSGKNKKNENSTKPEPDDKSVEKQKLDKDAPEQEDKLYITTADVDWLYAHLQQKRKSKVDGDQIVPYLHVLLEGASIETPENQVLKRDPVLEARCVKLRAQQEARDYRKMTKSVDNVRMRFPEDSISYQLKQMNRQLIAIGQFIISIFAGFLFGFRGVEWLVGNLDFGFRLLLGVMCALVIALAEIYFLAKKLNEELNIPETVQLGGPPKFAENSQYYVPKPSNSMAVNKEHQD